MDANFAQSVVVWSALSIGLASVVYCILSATGVPVRAESEEASDPTAEPEESFDLEEAA